MKYRTFANYREASKFARGTAMQHRRSVEITRQGGEFVVPDLGSASGERTDPTRRETNSSPPTIREDWWKSHLEEQKRREEEEATRRLAEKQRHDANKKRLEEQKRFFLERERYYRGLGDAQLDQEWADRDENELQPDERQLLRDIVRERKGITPVHGISVQACRSCGEVGENCTCGRSWF